MPTSVIDTKFQYSEKLWVVSIINTGEKVFGHAAIVIEGIKKDPVKGGPFLKAFKNHYDIRAETELSEKGKGIIERINEKGYISKVKCDEDDDNTRNYKKKNYPAQSWISPAKNVKEMISAIHRDRLRTEKAKENQVKILEGDEALHLDQDGSPYQFIRYQRLGENHPFIKLFGDSDEGQNCAGWCSKKLSEHLGIKINDFSKPKISAGQCFVS